MADEDLDKTKLQLREEVLNLTRKWEQYAEISWHKEVLREEKNLTIPLCREELVIEKKFTDRKHPEQPIQTETIRIPIKEERIEVNKHTFNLEEVAINKERLQQRYCVRASLKKEVPSIKILGNPKVEINDL